MWNMASRIMTSGPEEKKDALGQETESLSCFWRHVSLPRPSSLFKSLGVACQSQSCELCAPISERWSALRQPGSSPPIFSFSSSGDPRNGEFMRKDYSGIMPCRMAILCHLIEGIRPWTQPHRSLLSPLVRNWEVRPLTSLSLGHLPLSRLSNLCTDTFFLASLN